MRRNRLPLPHELAAAVAFCLCVGSVALDAQRIGPVPAAIYKKPEKAQEPVEARILPPSRSASLSRPQRVSLSTLTSSETARPRTPHPGRQLTGIHRRLPEKMLAIAPAGESFGMNVPGAWSKLPDSRRVWRLVIRSPGATAIRLHFQEFNVGDGLVWLYGEEEANDRTEGPFSGRGLFGDGDFWSPSVTSQNIVVEYLPPSGDERVVVPFRIDRLSHRILPLHKGKSRDPIEQDAPCSQDVTCFPAWKGTAASVAYLVFEDVGGSFDCSGTLLNTRNTSFAPYLLTAAHCIDSMTEARSLEAYWLYETSTCDGLPPPAVSVPRTNGAYLLAARGSGVNDNGGLPNPNGDFSLLLLVGGLPEGVTFSGWDPTDLGTPVGLRAAGIHHPNGSFKRITASEVIPNDNIPIPLSRAFLATQELLGRTEGGSSGSGLFDEPGVLIGVLSGGPSPPDPPITFCDFDFAWSYYARFSDFYSTIQPLLEETIPPLSLPGGTLISGSPADFLLPSLTTPTLFSSYVVDVPANASSLEVELVAVFPSSVEIDLFLSLGSSPYVSGGNVVADAASTQPGSNDRVRLDLSSQPPLRPGRYFVAVGLRTLNTFVRGTIAARIETTTPQPKPTVSEGGIVLATGTPAIASIAPNSIVTLFGREFAPAGTLALEPQLDAQGRVATSLANTCVEINGQRSPIFAVLPRQINLQASDNLTAGTGSVVVIRDCGGANEQRSGSASVQITGAAPGFFNFVNNSDGRNPIAALHGGGPDLLGPSGLFPGVSTTPAKPGEFVSLFATGLGPTNPPFAAGQIPGDVAPITGAVSVSIGGIPLPPEDVFYAGVAPCCAGLYQLVVKVPERAPDGDLPAIVSVDGVSTPPGPYVAVQR